MDNREIIQKSLDYIEENLKAEITALELAEMAGFSLFHYYRLFQQVTGLPVMQYILRRRLMHAAYAVKQGSTGIQAALRYGFDTYAGFYRAFSREFGFTPTEFIRSSRARRPWRIDLNREDSMTITPKRAARILKHWNLENETITDIYDEGTGARNESACYVGADYVLKHTENAQKLKKVIELSEYLSAGPIPTAAGESYITDGGVHFYLIRRLSGRQMTAQQFSAGDGRFVGEILGQLHLALAKIRDCVTEADLLATVRDWALPNARGPLNLTEQFCAAYLDALSRLYPKLPRQIIHRDPNPGNIICAEDQWGFIDFELSERNARIYDPCYAATAVLSETFGQDNDGWLEIYRELLRGYDSVAHLSGEEREAVPYVLLANQLVCVAWFADQDRYAELFAVNKRMTLWLLEHFEELKEF